MAGSGHAGCSSREQPANMGQWACSSPHPSRTHNLLNMYAWQAAERQRGGPHPASPIAPAPQLPLRVQQLPAAASRAAAPAAALAGAPAAALAGAPAATWAGAAAPPLAPKAASHLAAPPNHPAHRACLQGVRQEGGWALRQGHVMVFTHQRPATGIVQLPAAKATDSNIHCNSHTPPHRRPLAAAAAPGSAGRCPHQACRCRPREAASAGAVGSLPTRRQQAQPAAVREPAEPAALAGRKAARAAAAGPVALAGTRAAGAPDAGTAPRAWHAPAAMVTHRRTDAAMRPQSAAAGLAAVAAAAPPQSLAECLALAAAACCWAPRAGLWSAAGRRCGCGCGHACCRATPLGPCHHQSGGEGCGRCGAHSGCRCACGCVAAPDCVCALGRGCPCRRASEAAWPSHGSCCGPCCGCALACCHCGPGCGYALACCHCGGSRLLPQVRAVVACAEAWGQGKWPPRQPPRHWPEGLPGWWDCRAGW